MIEELKNEIQLHINEIDKYKKEIKKFTDKEKDYMKEKSLSMLELNKKENIIKEYNKKIEGMMKKYEEEANQFINLLK